MMPLPLFHDIADAWKDRLLDADHPSGAGKLFTAGRVFFPGHVAENVDYPIARLDFDEQDAAEGETTGKLQLQLPVMVNVHFDQNSGHGTQDIHTIQCQLFHAVYQAVMGSDDARELGGLAIVTDYLGGGTALRYIEEDAQSGVRVIQMRFETTYRHQVADCAAQI